MKRCPFCAEEIQDEAIICRFCSHDVRTPVPPPVSISSSDPVLGNGPLKGSPDTPAIHAAAPASRPSSYKGLGAVLVVIGFFATFVGGGAIAIGFFMMWFGCWLFLPGAALFRGVMGFVVALLMSVPAVNVNPSSRVATRAPSPSPAGASPNTVVSGTRDRFEIVSVDSRITESNQVWSRFAWKLAIRNQTSSALGCSATIEFLDTDGFVVDDDNAYNLAVPPGREETFTGYDLVDAGVVHKVKNTQAKVNCR